jgi:hypothetical protein
MSNLEELNSVHSRWQTETTVCRSIARALQPTQFFINGSVRSDPQLGGEPKIKTIQVGVAHQALSLGSGDIFDVKQLHDGRLCIFLADCSGPATPSGCLIGVAVRAAVENASRTLLTKASHILASVNQMLIAVKFPQVPVVAMGCAIVDPKKQTIEFARAGILPPVHVDQSGKKTELHTPGPLLGISEAEFTSENIAFSPGELFILSSFPLPNCTISTHFEGQKLANQLLGSISNDVRPNDDRTILVIHWHHVDSTIAAQYLS